MKKLVMTIAIVLGLGMSTFAQEDMQFEEKGLFGKGNGVFRGTGDELAIKLPELDYGTTDDQDGPLGSGIAVLMGLGAAYMVAKKRREE